MPHDIRQEPDGFQTMCCGRKKCPGIRFGEGGVGGVIRNDAGEETEFDDAQLDALAHLILTRKTQG